MFLKKITLYLFLFFCTSVVAVAQGGYGIKQYMVDVKVNQDASLEITETIDVHFTEMRRGIFRLIPYKYLITALTDGAEKADRQLESNGMTQTIIEEVDVPGWKFVVSNEGTYKKIRIGDKDTYITGDQQYVIRYKVLNAINFFKDKSELYLNIIGDRWDVPINSVIFSVSLYDALPIEPAFFVATGYTGSKENKTVSKWVENKVFTGNTTEHLMVGQGLTLGIVFPSGFLEKQNYMLRGLEWLLQPIFVFFLMFLVWRRWGKDDPLTITTEFYPPKNVSPSVAGYLVDDRLDRRDLTALIPYWGGGGYLQVKETEKSTLLGLVKNTEYEFLKVKDLPASALTFEKTFFNGIFNNGDKVALSSLKDVFYKTMAKARGELVSEVDAGAYYVKYSRGIGCVFSLFGFGLLVYGLYCLIAYWGNPVWLPVSFIASAIIIFVFAALMSKKTEKGTDLVEKLKGFKEFIKKVEKDRLALFLKENPHYFDIVLPFAIVFGVADTWKDKLKGLDVPPPDWYAGSYHGFTTHMFLNNLDKSMNAMSSSFYSSPGTSGGGSSGGSWSSGGGGGGFSGGGFGGGGGSSW